MWRRLGASSTRFLRGIQQRQISLSGYNASSGPIDSSESPAGVASFKLRTDHLARFADGAVVASRGESAMLRRLGASSTRLLLGIQQRQISLSGYKMASLPVVESMEMEEYKQKMLFNRVSRKIQSATGVKISMKNGRNISLSAPNGEDLERAKAMIKELVTDSEETQIELGKMITVECVALFSRGIHVTITPNGNWYYIPSSQLHWTPLEHPSDIGLKVGDQLTVQWKGRYPITGLVKMSRLPLRCTEIIDRVMKREGGEIASPRAHYKEFIPVVESMQLEGYKQGILFQSNGMFVNQIEEATGVKIAKYVSLRAPNREELERAKTMIKELTTDIEETQLESGKIITVECVTVHSRGINVRIKPNWESHYISHKELYSTDTPDPTAIEFKVGDRVTVQWKTLNSPKGWVLMSRCEGQDGSSKRNDAIEEDVDTESLSRDHYKDSVPVLESLDLETYKQVIFSKNEGLWAKIIEAETGVKISRDISLTAPNRQELERAKTIIKELTTDNEETQIEYGEIITVECVKILDGGIRVKITPNGMSYVIGNKHLHSSPIEHPSDIGLKVGDQLTVQWLGRSIKGKVQMSRLGLQNGSDVIASSSEEEAGGENTPRDRYKVLVPVVEPMRLEPYKHPKLFQGNATKILAKTAVKISQIDDWNISLTAPNREELEKAKEMIREVTADSDETQIEIGKVIKVECVDVHDTGINVRITPDGRTYYIHNDQLISTPIQHPSDIGLKIGDRLTVQWLGINHNSGWAYMSRLGLQDETGVAVDALEKEEEPGTHPREHNKESVSVVESLQLEPYKQLKLIQGKVGRIQAKTGVKISKSDDWNISLTAPNREELEKAKTMIKELTADSEETQIEIGKIITVEIASVIDEGISVKLTPNGKSYNIFNKFLHPTTIQHPSEIGLKVGDRLRVKWMGRDPTTGFARMLGLGLQGASDESNAFMVDAERRNHKIEHDKASMPVVESLQLEPYKQRKLFDGKKASKIQARTGVKISQSDDWNISLTAPNREELKRAKKMIRGLTADRKETQIELGKMITVEIVTVQDGGVYVRIKPNGKSYNIKNKYLHWTPIRHPTDIGLKVFDRLTVQWLGLDPTTGFPRMSRLALQGASDVYEFVEEEEQGIDLEQ